MTAKLKTPLTKNTNRAETAEPIADAIDFLVENFDRQPDLEETAAHVGLSPSHFQRQFKAGAGVSPKRFLQYLAAMAAKQAIADGQSVMSASFAAGLSGPSRLHDLFLVSEAMTPGAYRKKGAGLEIRFAFVGGPFGRALIGATERGICWLSFSGLKGDDEQIAEMKSDWTAAIFVEDEAYIVPLAEQAFAFASNKRLDKPLGLHVQGTNFQLKVWEALLRIPYGGLVTYGDIARDVCSARASRAVGSAVGANMISLLIPCHRVILSSGAIHNYRWGVERKKTILAMEQAVAAG